MRTLADLNRLLVKDVVAADVVVVASTVLNSPCYYRRLARLGGCACSRF